jgi:hypothetical protein
VSKTVPSTAVSAYVVLAFIGGVVAALLLADLTVGRQRAVVAQPAGDVRMGARGLFAAVGQLNRDRDALYLIDADSQVICVYDYNAASGRMSLAAVRSFLHDRKLSDFNCDLTTSPQAIQDLVEKTRPVESAPGVP